MSWSSSFDADCTYSLLPSYRNNVLFCFLSEHFYDCVFRRRDYQSHGTVFHNRFLLGYFPSFVPSQIAHVAVPIERELHKQFIYFYQTSHQAGYLLRNCNLINRRTLPRTAKEMDVLNIK